MFWPQRLQAPTSMQKPIEPVNPDGGLPGIRTDSPDQMAVLVTALIFQEDPDPVFSGHRGQA